MGSGEYTGMMIVCEEIIVYEEVMIVYEEEKEVADVGMLTLPISKNFSVSRKIIIFTYFYKFFNTKIIFIYLSRNVESSELVATRRIRR